MALNWQTLACSLRRFFARLEDLSGREQGLGYAGGRVRVDAFAVLAPCVDAVGFFAAVCFGTSAESAQITGFVLAVALNLASLVRTHLQHTLRWSFSRYWAWIAVAVLAFFLRSGSFGLLRNVCTWPVQVAIGVAVLITAAMLRAGLVYCAEGGSLRLGVGKDWRTMALGLVVCAWLLRLIYCAQIELWPTEAYYWNYSRHLDFGYLDHPPMVALLIRAGIAAFGNTKFGVRIGALCVSLGTTFFCYRLTRNLFAGGQRGYERPSVRL